MQNCRVLLPEIGIRRNIGTDSYRGPIQDYSIASYQITELIAHGAIEVYLDDRWREDEIFDKNVAEELRKRIKFIDKDQDIRMKAVAFLKPIAESLGNEFMGAELKWYVPKIASEKALHSLYRDVYYLFLGLESHALIGLNLEQMIANSEFLLGKVLGSKSKQNLALLLGLLRSYEATSISSLKMISGASGELVGLFTQFVEDEAYKELSHQHYNLGIRDKIKRSKTEISRLTKKLLKKPFAKDVVDVTSKGISVSTGVPMPSSSILDNIVFDSYLPPIGDINGCLARAWIRWANDDPEIVVPEKWQFLL